MWNDDLKTHPADRAAKRDRLAALFIATLALLLFAGSAEAQEEEARERTATTGIWLPDGTLRLELHDPKDERRLLKAIEIMNRRWEQAPTPVAEDRVRALVGSGRARDLSAARFMFHLHMDPFLDQEMRPAEMIEPAEDAVISTFLKLEREALIDALGVERWLERRVSRLAGGGEDRDGRASTRGGWLDFSPQVDVGSRNRLGVRVSPAIDGPGPWSRLSLRVRHDFAADSLIYDLKFDDGNRFFYLSHDSHTELGNRYSLSVRFWF